MAKITFTNKQDLISTGIPEVNKVTASTINTIKSVVNFNDDAKTEKGGYVGTSNDLKDAIDNAVFSGLITYQTEAELLAVSPIPTNGTPAKVANNVADPTKNGNWSVVSGAWLQDASVVSNIANSVDIKTVGDELQFNNRDKTLDSLGYKYIRSDFDFTAIPVGYDNSIWEIRDFFDLSGVTVTMPENVQLYFNGGKFENCTIIGNNTEIIADNIEILGENITFSGTFKKKPIKANWFGVKGDYTTNSQPQLQRALNFCKSQGLPLVLSTGGFMLSDNLDFSGANLGFSFKGMGKKVTELICNYNDVGKSIIAFSNSVNQIGLSDFSINGDYILGTRENNHGIAFFDSSNVEIKNVSIKKVNNSGILAYVSGAGVIGDYKNIHVRNVDIYGENETENGILLVDLEDSGMESCYVEKVTEFALELKNSCNRCYIRNSTAKLSGAGIYFGQTTGLGVKYSLVSDVQVISCDESIVLGYASYNKINNIQIDLAGAVSLAGVVNISTNSTDNNISGVTIQSFGTTPELVRYRGGSKRNTIKIDGINATALGNLVGHDATSELNHTSFDNIFNNGVQVYSVKSLVRDNSGVLTNKVAYTFISGLVMELDASGIVYIQKGKSGRTPTSTQSFVFESSSPTQPPIIALIPNADTGAAGLQVQNASSKSDGGITYDLAGRYWQFEASDVAVLRIYSTTLRPSTDNVTSLGTAAHRYTELFAANGTINTSDERLKSELIDISIAEKNCAQDLKSAIKKYKFLDSIDKKGDNARIHFGVGAQTVKNIFESHNLDANKYALFCFDSWEGKEELTEKIADENGVEKDIIVQEYEQSGDRFGIRYEQLLAFIISSI